jgi:hypothetical protein
LAEALYYKPEGRGFESRRGDFFFNSPNPSSRTMAPQFDSASNTNDYQKCSWGVKGCQPAHKSDNLTAICELSRKCGSLDVSQPYGPSRPVTGIALPFF